MGIGSHDTVQHAAVLFQSRSFEDDGVFDADALTDGDVGTDSDVGANLGGRVDGGRGVDKGGWDDVGRGGREEGRVGGFVVGKVESGGCNCRAVVVFLSGFCVYNIRIGDSRGSFDLSPEIMCLVDVHFPRSSQWHNHILLQTENLVRLDEWIFPVDPQPVSQSVSQSRASIFFRVLLNNSRGTGRLFIHGNLDDIKQGLVKEIHSTVDNIRDPAFGLFDIVDHLVGLWVSDDAAVLRSRLLFDIDTHNGAGAAMGGVQLEHLGKGERAADVNVADKDVLRDGRAEDRVADWETEMSAMSAAAKR